MHIHKIHKKLITRFEEERNGERERGEKVQCGYENSTSIPKLPL